MFVASAQEQCAFAGCSVGFRTTRTWDVAVWAHVEPNVEFRTANGLALRVYGGPSFVLNDQSARCESTLPNGCPSSIGSTAWYGGLTAGYAF